MTQGYDPFVSFYCRQSLRFAEAELTVWGASVTQRIAPGLGRTPLKTALVRRRIDTVGGYDGGVRRLGSVKVWRSRGAFGSPNCQFCVAHQMNCP